MNEATYGLPLAYTALASGFLPFCAVVVLALLVRYAHVAIPVVSAYSFETLLVGVLLLLAGNMFRGF
jgi:hypothetical protein